MRCGPIGLSSDGGRAGRLSVAGGGAAAGAAVPARSTSASASAANRADSTMANQEPIRQPSLLWDAMNRLGLPTDPCLLARNVAVRIGDEGVAAGGRTEEVHLTVQVD